MYAGGIGTNTGIYVAYQNTIAYKYVFCVSVNKMPSTIYSIYLGKYYGVFKKKKKKKKKKRKGKIKGKNVKKESRFYVINFIDPRIIFLQGKF